MSKKIVTYLMLILLLGGGMVILGRLMSGGPRQTAQAEASAKFLAVTRPLERGEFLEPKDLEWRILSANIPSAEGARFFSGKPEDLEGAVMCNSVRQGQFLTAEDYIKPGEAAFLSAVLKPSMRAVALRVNDVTGGAGLIRPGNQVDVILSGRLEHDDSGLPSAQTLLQNVRVIAVNRDTAGKSPETRETGDRNAPRPDLSKKGTVTLEVNPKEAELLTVAESLGVLSLSLRSLIDNEGAIFAEQPNRLTRAADLVRRPDQNSGARRPVVALYGAGQDR
ncbi:MAG: Flp pilus assembly protein CpaB [Candidatus Adiutrix sp.]|jgi:pilus assembly protein CpaB|nr:Flp pilus assembly protein CpaB [Candidatus Adiutrix sp.]